MRHTIRQWLPNRAALLFVTILPVLALAPSGCTTLVSTSDFSATQYFPVPAGLVPSVEFWRKVYAEWSRAQVVVHDDRYLDLIYQVAELPGPIKASYTPRQRDFVDSLKASWQARLQELSRKLASKAPLTSEERALKNKLSAAGGGAALIDPAARVRTQRGLRERFRRGLEISGGYEQAFREIFRRHGVPEDLAFLPHVESSFQLNARSSAGATGMWQFIRSTGRQYMRVDNQIDERLDPFIAADAAARYLAQAYSKLGSWPLAITSYNHGVGGMSNARAIHGDDIASIVKHYRGRYFGFASRNFYAEFIAARHVAKHPQEYFPEIHYEKPIAQRRVSMTKSQRVNEVARELGVPVYELIRANPAWLGPIRDGRAPIPAGSTLWLPGGQAPSKDKQQRAMDAPLFGAHPASDLNPELAPDQNKHQTPGRPPRSDSHMPGSFWRRTEA
ncbi:Membrane-bound lytic murein transglycosylase D precursor [Thiorhodovibrio winogradskyi]|uniref:Membrane-bound lytic murein transglycosylase D n=1 Tax=Thiorhodovibrio winogradskyi TaxID=77007 RepID=A0ABZ0S599_9GAMM|nr:lytic transglycosylase domain-containing protein [Thiorhodovibrio winogradskyi]